MAYDPQAEMEKMSQNLKKATGKDMVEWGEVARASGMEKHGELVNFLTSEYRLRYGFANMVVHNLHGSAHHQAGDADELLEKLFSGAKVAMRPTYDLIIAEIEGLGDDVAIIPMKAYVSVRRNKQFACIRPATASRIDLGIKMKGIEPGGRLEAGGFNGMVSHLVKIGGVDEVDDEAIGWLRKAYEGA